MTSRASARGHAAQRAQGLFETSEHHDPARLHRRHRPPRDRAEGQPAQHTEELLRQKQVLLEEMQHRVANSLQIIASILLLKARAVTSKRPATTSGRPSARDVGRRGPVASPCLRRHRPDRGRSPTSPNSAHEPRRLHGRRGSRPIAIPSVADDHDRSDKAVSLGLIVTELVINAIKYAFPDARPDARIRVSYAASGSGWNLSVSDNGVGRGDARANFSGGLGTAIVAALSKQLGADTSVTSDAHGLEVLVTSKAVDGVTPLAA